MAKDLGRSEFLDAATAIKKMRGLLESKRREVDTELAFFVDAEKALAILGESDRIKAEFETRITSAQVQIKDLDREVQAAQTEASVATSRARAEANEAARKAKAETDAVMSKETEKRKSSAERIAEMDATLKAAEKETASRLNVLGKQISEKEAALSSLRSTIAELAKV